jgi:hypothetical protein
VIIKNENFKEKYYSMRAQYTFEILRFFSVHIKNDQKYGFNFVFHNHDHRSKK